MDAVRLFHNRLSIIKAAEKAIRTIDRSDKNGTQPDSAATTAIRHDCVPFYLFA